MDDGNVHFDRSDLYRDYAALKEWGSGEIVDDFDRFSRTFRKLRLVPAAAVLEIGFGEGRFLDWARNRGYKVEGVEILPEMVDYARARGHIAHLGEVKQLERPGSRFDLLAAFDVIEHLTLLEIIDLLDDAKGLLAVNGQILLQFPNAASPFCAYYQYGDATHRSALSKPSLEQIARTRGWTVVHFFNARGSSSHPLKQAKMWIAHVVRDCIEIVLGFVYYGTRRPLDPNIIVVLERTVAQTHGMTGGNTLP